VLTQGHPGRIQSNRLLYIGAMLVLAGWSLAGWSLANAAPIAESLATARAAMASRAHSVGMMKLNIPPPALTATKAPTRPLPLDEPRPTRVNSQAMSSLPENYRNRDADPQLSGAFPIQWRESREIVSADIVSLVRNYRRDGLPIVQLYQSQQNRLAIGLNTHGVPGIYFTRHIGG
jgi:hypothetical protein